MRFLFDFGASSKKRTVVGKQLSIDIKRIEYLQESTGRLNSLYELYNRYRNTPHAPKLKAVYEKTKEIHAYLVYRNRLHELELFHLQHTDHFISTFTVIMDAHQQSLGPNFNFVPPELRKGPAFMIPEPSSTGRKARTPSSVEMVKMPNGQAGFFNTEDPRNPIPKLGVPEVSINTFVKLSYQLGDGTRGIGAEIGFTSTPQEKENFLRYVSAQLGISHVSYVGNALLTIANSNGSNPTGMVPILHWAGFMYALNLNDFRLFPVQIQKKSS